MSDYSVPSFVLDKDNEIHLTIPPTTATLADQGYTYNQAGITYNQTGVQYGGVANINFAEIPHLSGIYDIYAPKPVPPVTGSNNGPGWFMYINLT